MSQQQKMALGALVASAVAGYLYTTRWLIYLSQFGNDQWASVQGAWEQHPSRSTCGLWQGMYNTQKALWCVLTPTILAEYINRIETNYSRRRARRERLSATSFQAGTMSKRLLALRCGRQNCQPSILYMYQEKEETDVPPSKLKMAKVEVEVEKWLKGLLDHKNHASSCICINYPLN